MNISLLNCGHAESPHPEFTTGYGTDSKGRKHCYDCCAEQDKQQMREHGVITLYLNHETFNNITGNHAKGEVSNWPGSFKIPCSVKRGRHNIARNRYDVWFMFEGNFWHGVQYGDFTQLCHCKRVKGQ